MTTSLFLRRRAAKLALALTLGLFSGCQDSLQEEIYSFVSADNFYKTASDAEAAVIAAYQPFTSDDYFRRGFYNVGLLADDQVMIGRNATFQAVDNFNVTPDHPFHTALWQQMYLGINRSNTGIQRIPTIAMDETRRASLVGECRYVRAYNYFNLVRLFGGVPMPATEIQSQEQTNNPKAPKEKVYEQIVADLLEAEKVLPLTRPDAEWGRATKGAAQTLLAEVYLTTERWQQAADKAKEVIDSKQYQLLADFKAVFSISNEANAEIIQSIQFDGPTIGTWFASFNHAGGTDNPNCFLGSANWSVEQKSDIWLNWDAKDGRKAASTYDKFVNKAGKLVSVFDYPQPFPGFGKYNAPAEISNGNSPCNPIVHRYADVLLIYAEAAAQAAGTPPAAAYDAVNQVRRRGYKVPLNAPSEFDVPPGLSKEAFRQAVVRERSLEFVIENKRLFDLMRTGQFPAILKGQGKTIREGATLFPIPLSELNSNLALTPADQNPGY